MFGKSKPPIVVSEPDIQAALKHFRQLPFRDDFPLAWDRQYVIGKIRRAVGAAPKIGDFVQVGPGVYGLVNPFGVDLAGGPSEESRLQVWIVIRTAGTDPANITEL